MIEKLSSIDNQQSTIQRPMLKQVQIENYKSFASTKVVIQPFTVLVGPNGAGKSNFVDALRFVDEDAGLVLSHDGSNAAAVLREIQKNKPDDYERLTRLLSLVAPSITKVEYTSIGQKETLSFKQDMGDTTPLSFEAISMSDGTLRALSILLAVYQSSCPSLIAIEEPEATIHPAAMEVLVDILFSGAYQSQILLTTHSPELLDDKDISLDNLLVVSLNQGKTEICPIGELSRKAYISRLATLGELLTAGELEGERL